MSSLAGSNVPRIREDKDLDQVTDLFIALTVMKDLRINTEGVTNLEEAKAKIKLNFSRRSAEQIYNEQDRVLKEAVSADRSNRQTLKDMFKQSLDLVHTLPPHFQEDLKHVFPAVDQTLQGTMQQLHQSDCIIVVAGEKGAGKSSLINLVAGCEILPTDMVNGTRTICELRHSEQKRFVAYCKDRKRNPVERECRDERECPHFLKELTEYVTYVDPATETSPFMKIDIFWPLPILGEGVVMVDTPGVGESRSVSRQLEDYMSRAFGFIYVINTSNAGGIQRDRLGQLLRQAVERADMSFDPSTALFVCNWWDQVQTHEQKKVLDRTLARLTAVWPGTTAQQIFPISSKKSLDASRRGIILDDYRQLVAGIRNVLPITFKSKLTSHYRLLSAVLKRVLYTLKISTNIGRKQMAEKETAFYNIRNQIDVLEKDAGGQIDVMRDGFQREVDNINRRLGAYLKSDQFMNEVCNWSPDECPRLEKDTKKTLKEACSRFQLKLARLVDAWEEKSEIVTKVRSNILKAYKRDLELFEDQIKRIEGVLFDGVDNRIITDLHNSMRIQMPVKNVWKKAKAPDRLPEKGCFSLGSAISGCHNLDIKANPVKNAATNKSLTSQQMMSTLTQLFLQQYREEEITSAVRKFFDRIAKRFDAASRLLPEFLKADRALMHTLQGEVQGEQERLASMYPKLISSVTSLQGNLDMFFVTKLMLFDFNMKDLKYNPVQQIGRGSFADVFSSSVPSPTGGEKITVALKIQRDKLTARNVTDVLLEDRTLRDIRHKNIIKYYGAAKERQNNNVRWVMVLEYCTRTIKQRFMSEDAKVPGKGDDIASLQMDRMREVALFASQICSALCYLHNKGIVHRDLKPDNILLTEKDEVKLTDVGLAKPAIDIAGSLAGTPVYMAPEVLLQKGQYDMKADVYSMAVIVWELWYGQDAADHISSHLFGRLEDAVQNGLRPSLTMNHKPPDDWLSLIKAGWEFEASRRITSQDMAVFFDNFLAKTKG